MPSLVDIITFSPCSINKGTLIWYPVSSVASFEAFEVVFPKYVKEVTIQNANVLYENGLKIGRIDTYTENDIVRIRVELEGIQKTFSESSITNGTNIIINANIKVD